MEQVTQENAASAEETASFATGLERQADIMLEVVSRLTYLLNGQQAN